MILSKLFSSKANWQHKDSSVRVAAIENELTLESDQDVQIIKQVAVNDESDLVRRAALLKLNNIDAWLNHGLKDKSAATVKAAEKAIVDFIISQNSEQVALSDRAAIIDGISKNLAEQALQQTTDVELIAVLIKKIDKPQLLTNLFTQKQASEALQRYVVENTSDKAQLEKLLKKAQYESVSKEIHLKLSQIVAEQEKPLKLAKDAQLALSKLLALKDVADYEQVVDKRRGLNEEWQVLSAEFSVLEETKANELTQKYDGINTTLTKVFIAKEEQFQQEKIARQLKEKQKAERQTFSQFINDVSQAISNAIFENEEINQADWLEKLESFEEQVESSSLVNDDKKAFRQSSREISERLSKVSEIAKSVANATHLIAKMAQQHPPENQNDLSEKSAFFQQWLKEWKDNAVIANSVLPDSLNSAYVEIKTNWQNAIKPLEKAQEKLFFQCQRKSSDVKRLVASGKYNTAFGVYKKFDALFAQLLPVYQRRLQRDHDQLSSKINDLSDWEHYVATPKKQALLEDVKVLADNPLDNPKEQANKVKHFRKLWNSLGHAEEDVEGQLNSDFNNACEKAFAPCRSFYSEQEKAREVHLATRRTIVEEAKSLNQLLSDTAVDYKRLETQLNKLQQKWREAGDVDRNVYKVINNEFMAFVKPAKAAILKYHQDNTELKQKLIETAKTLLTLDDVFSAVNQLKSLQSDWKKIGYAGVKFENNLWKQFRAVNDEVFAKRTALQSERQQANDARLSDVKSSVDSLAAQASAKRISKAELLSIKEQAQAIQNSLKDEDYVHQGALKLVEELQVSLTKHLAKNEKQQKQQDWVSLFWVLEQLAKGASLDTVKNEESYQKLSQAKKRKLSDAIDKMERQHSSEALRAHQTIELEILAGVESPAEFQQERMSIQVAMMQSKMNSGEMVSLEDKFWSWLSVEPVTNKDLPFINRAKLVFEH